MKHVKLLSTVQGINRGQWLHKSYNMHREFNFPSSVVFTSVEGEISSAFPEGRAREIKFHLFTNFSLSTSSMPGSVLGAGYEA